MANAAEQVTLYVNAVIHTMDPATHIAEAVAVSGNRILAVGSNSDLRGRHAQARRVDLGGRLLLPGFNDAHVHFISGGFSLFAPDLRNTATPREFADGIAAYARKLPANAWILGGEWDHEKWPGTPLPTRNLVDKSTTGHPMLVSRFDGHMALANSQALQLAGIDRNTPDPAGGLIVRDAKGEPTGVLKDSAQDLVTRIIPPRTAEEKRAATLAATHHAASLGVTSVSDMSADDDVPLYQTLAREGLLKTRIYGARPITSWEKLAAQTKEVSPANQIVRIGAIKGFSDGSLGSSTAYFFDPYADQPDNRGLLFDQMFPDGIMLDRVRACDKAGLQVMIHAIGDAANRIILDIYERVAAENRPRDRRFRIEHAQHLHADDIARFGRQQVIASMQPYHAADDGCWCERRIGAARCAGAYAFRSLLKAGAILAFGSDWLVAPLDPIPAIKAAVTRQTLDGKHPDGWVPEECITVGQAVRACTMGSAYAEFAENEKGSITPGKLADFVVLDKNIFKMDPQSIDSAKVILTVMNGRKVFEKSGVIS